MLPRTVRTAFSVRMEGRGKEIISQKGTIWREVYVEDSGCQCLLGQPWLKLRDQRSCSVFCATAKFAFWNLRHRACSLYDVNCSLLCWGEQVVAHFYRSREGSGNVYCLNGVQPNQHYVTLDTPLGGQRKNLRYKNYKMIGT